MTAETETQSVGGWEAARRAGVTARQLDYWIRSGLLVPVLEQPTGSGVPRHLTGADIEALVVLGRLMPLRDFSRRDVADRIKELVESVQRNGAVGEFELIPGVTVDLERLVEDVTS